MMAAVRHFMYRGGGREVIPLEATHVAIHRSVKVVPAKLFIDHPNIVEFICNFGVEEIGEKAFQNCHSLERAILLGVKLIEVEAFSNCTSLKYVESPKVERIEFCAFDNCESLTSVCMPPVKLVYDQAFLGCALKDATFGKNLEYFDFGAFSYCESLERITIPLKKDLVEDFNVFNYCDNLKRVDLVEGEELHETISSLQLEEWRDDMNREVDSINQILPFTPAGSWENSDEDSLMKAKTWAIQKWIDSVLHKIIRYKADHRRILTEAASMLEDALPKDIIVKSVLPFLRLPRHRFDGEDDEAANRVHWS